MRGKEREGGSASRPSRRRALELREGEGVSLSYFLLHYFTSLHHVTRTLNATYDYITTSNSYSTLPLYCHPSLPLLCHCHRTPFHLYTSSSSTPLHLSPTHPQLAPYSATPESSRVHPSTLSSPSSTTPTRFSHHRIILHLPPYHRQPITFHQHFLWCTHRHSSSSRRQGHLDSLEKLGRSYRGRDQLQGLLPFDQGDQSGRCCCYFRSSSGGQGWSRGAEEEARLAR